MSPQDDLGAQTTLWLCNLAGRPCVCACVPHFIQKPGMHAGTGTYPRGSWVSTGTCSRSRPRRDAGGSRSAYPPSSRAACNAASSHAPAWLLCAAFHSASAGHRCRALVMACSEHQKWQWISSRMCLGRCPPAATPALPCTTVCWRDVQSMHDCAAYNARWGVHVCRTPSMLDLYMDVSLLNASGRPRRADLAC